jgi:hypothetical protein
MPVDRYVSRRSLSSTLLIGLALGAAGFPAPAAALDEPPREGIKWYLGTGLGPGIDARYKFNGQTITFDDRLQGATDKTGLIGLNLINGGIALTPRLLVGGSVSAVAQSGKIAGDDTHIQINNYLAMLTYFPFEHGFYVRGGAGYSNITIEVGSNSDSAGGIGILVGAGYNLRLVGRHYLSFAVDQSFQSYGSSDTKPESSRFSAAYLGYMYRR